LFLNLKKPDAVPISWYTKCT